MDIDILKENYIDQLTAANMLKITQGRISQLCQEGRFDGATKIGWSWVIPRSSVENFQRKRRGVKPKSYNEKSILQAAIQEADNLKKLKEADKQ